MDTSCSSPESKSSLSLHQPVIPVTPETSELEPQAAQTPALWNYRQLLIAILITLVSQLIFLPCMCMEGGVKVHFALMFDGFVMVRLLIAFMQQERGRTWLFYVVLLYTSPVWITILISWLAGL
jgi:hypothetical protein